MDDEHHDDNKIKAWMLNNGKEQSVAVDKDEDKNDEPAANQADDDEIQNIENNMTADEAATVPTTAKLQVKVKIVVVKYFDIL